MIEILDKHKCVGCRACEQICPKQCIEIYTDDEGFKYPRVNLYKCINCHLCEKVCPVLTSSKPKAPLKAIGCKSNDKNIQINSSSGGMFTVLAEKVLKQGGVIFGAIFDENFKVIHSCTDSSDDIDSFRRSKYVQSDTLQTFTSVKETLTDGRTVLFCGTPCQIKGLKLFLRKPFDNLITVDFICHGVPSPKVWHDYINALGEKIGTGFKLSSANFRSKSAGGWHRFALEFVFTSEDGKTRTVIQHPHDNPYYQLFFQNISLRPSCYKCPAKGFSSGSDLTLADFWGIHKIAPEFDDNNGISLLFVNTDKGKDLIDTLTFDGIEIPVDKATESNPSAYHSVSEPLIRAKFFNGQSNFTLSYLKKFSGLDLKGRTRRWIIEQILKFVKL